MASDEISVHKDLQLAQIKTSEAYTREVKEATLNFTNPFSIDNMDELFCLSSSKPTPKEVRDDLLQAKDPSQQAMECQFLFMTL